MANEFWHSSITEKSWSTLLELKRKFGFVLIGGWAVYLYTHAIKSRDIDLVLDYDELARLRKTYPVVKNDRLKKYEARAQEVEIDLYLPHYSNPGLPAEIILKETVVRDGIRVPAPEVLLLLKLNVFKERKGSTKGEKDSLDIFSMLSKGILDYKRLLSLSQEHQKENLLDQLRSLLKSTSEVPQIGLNAYHVSRLKKEILPILGSS